MIIMSIVAFEALIALQALKGHTAYMDSFSKNETFRRSGRQGLRIKPRNLTPMRSAADARSAGVIDSANITVILLTQISGLCPRTVRHVRATRGQI